MAAGILRWDRVSLRVVSGNTPRPEK